MRVRDPRLLVVVSAVLLGAAIAFPLGVIASHQFTDVPNTNSFHTDIDAIKEAGVTTGCSATTYCPKDFVTREQMAAFLNRLGALGEGKTPVVNAKTAETAQTAGDADKVDGRHASDLTYVIDNLQSSPVQVTTGSWQAFEQVTIVAPTDGFVLVNASVSLTNVSCTQLCIVAGAIESTDIALANTVSQTNAEPGFLTSMSMTRVIPVQAGSRTLQVRLWRHGSSDGVILHSYGQLTAIFSPFGETQS